MKIAYLYNLSNTSSYAGRTIANGFKNAFEDIKQTFSFFDIEEFKKPFKIYEKIKFLSFSPDIIFTSVENIEFLPLKYLNSTKLVLWGQFYSKCDYEPQIHTISDKTKTILNKYSAKHDILIWSQHEDEINSQFFSGYEKELGLKFLQLLHAADKTQQRKPVLDPEFDFLWVGNIGHRKDLYNKIITPLKGIFPRFIEFNEHSAASPEKILSDQFYSRSFFAPNIHTDAQIKNSILVNERVFSSTLQGGFQLCDNPIARKYFTEEELIIANDLNSFVDVIKYYRKHPERRLQVIKNMNSKILEKHTYHARIEAIFKKYNTD